MLRARARRPRTLRARCAAVAPRAHHAVTGVRHRLIGVAYARTAALAGCRSVFAPPAPRREAGRLRSVGLFARVDAARAAAIASGPCAHRCGGESLSPPRYCCCARLPSSVVGPSGLRARRGMASPGAVSSALRAARALRRVVSASGRRARVFRGAKARRAGLAAGVIHITGRSEFLRYSRRPFRCAVRCRCQAV